MSGTRTLNRRGGLYFWPPTRRWLTPSALVTAAFLLAATWLWPGCDEACSAQRRAPDPPPFPILAPTAEPAGPPARQPEDLAAAILARPLFQPDRRPPSPTRSPGETPPGPDALPRLSGMMATGAERWAVFAPENAAPLVVHEGASVGPWRVREVRIGEGVLLDGPGHSLMLRPVFVDAATVAVSIGPVSSGVVTQAPLPQAVEPPGASPGDVVVAPGPVAPLAQPRLRPAFYQRGASHSSE